MAEIHRGGGSRRGGLVLPEELLEEILVRLPVKSILRFESVCKTWRSKFHSGPFMALFRGGDYKSEPFHTIALEDVYRMAPGLADGDEKYRVIAAMGLSSNGIYCLISDYMDAGFFSLLAVKIALCNPATRQVKFVEPFPTILHFLLACISECNCELAWGFGTVQTSSSLDYRVVMVINYSQSGCFFYRPCFLVLVYSSQRGKWKLIADYRPAGERSDGGPSADGNGIRIGIGIGIGIEGRRLIGMFAPTKREACPQRFFKGCWYWVAIRLGEDTDTCYLDVLSFNFAAQSFELMGGPPGGNAFQYSISQLGLLNANVVVLHQHLAVIYLFNRMRVSTDFGVWMMMDYGVEESWTRIYTLNYPDCLGIVRLYGLDYSSEEEESGVRIKIKRLLFAQPFFPFWWKPLAPGRRRGWTGEIFSFDDKGQRQVTALRGSSDHICFSTAGISTYVETLQRL